MMHSVLLAFILVTATLSASQPASQSAPKVTVTNGTYAGIHDTTFNQDVFLGIPFAQPPSSPGSLRFRRPLSLNSTWSGTRYATEFGYDCPSYPSAFVNGSSNFSEDCLTLNVARPTGAQSLPVAVWIYGGAFVAGSSSQSSYNLSWFVNASVSANKPLIAVSLNYRLNYFGFLAGPDISAEGNTNVGLYDQRLALHWVKENIAAFGGDPSKITVFGESAGAMSIAAHMLAFGGRNDNLFRAAIMESGAPTTGLYGSATSASADSAYNTVVSQAGCSSASNKLACLRSLSFSTLYDALQSTTFALNAFFPVIDGGFIASSPSKQLLNGQYIKIPTIQGHNDDEGALFSLSTDSNSDNDTRTFITSSWPFFTSSDVNQLMSDYPNIPSEGVPYGRLGNTTFPAYGTQWRRVASIEGDVLFIGPCRLFTSTSSFTGGQTVYRYRLNLTVPSFPPMWGATHGADVSYVWNTPSLRTDADTSRTIDFVSRAWASFVVDLTPNHHGLQNIATWNPYSTSTTGQNFVIALNNFSTELDTFRVPGITVINDAVLKL